MTPDERPEETEPMTCKVGTVPAMVILRRGTLIKVGRKLDYRMAMDGTKWERGLVTKINPGGYFFMDKI